MWCSDAKCAVGTEGCVREPFGTRGAEVIDGYKPAHPWRQHLTRHLIPFEARAQHARTRLVALRYVLGCCLRVGRLRVDERPANPPFALNAHDTGLDVAIGPEGSGRTIGAARHEDASAPA